MSKHFVEVIRNQARQPDMVITRFPVQDFNHNSTLIVEQGQMAVFANKGLIENVFSPGTYRLNTQNYPFLTRLVSVLSGGVSRFHCEIFFVSMVPSPNLRFGTEAPIPARDKAHNLLVDVSLFGSLRLRVTDPEALIRELAGVLADRHWNDLAQDMKGVLNGKIRSAAARALDGWERELISANAELSAFSRSVSEQLARELSPYGLEPAMLEIGGMNISREKYDRLDESNIERYCTENRAAAEQTAIGLLQSNWKDYRYYHYLDTLAANPNAKFFQFGDPVSGMMRQMGSDPELARLRDQLVRLKRLQEEGLLSQEEYTAKREALLREL